MKIQLIGLTGQTGAGKTTVAALLREAGYTVLDCDIYARQAVAPGSPVLETLAETFGGDILLPDGSLDRRGLAAKAFAAPEATARLNAIVHPAVTEMVMRDAQAAAERGERFAFVDAALLFESDLHALCAFTVTVCAPKSVRLKRIMARDGFTEQQARQRMAAQQSDAFYRKHADFVIENSGAVPLTPQIQLLEGRRNALADAKET